MSGLSTESLLRIHLATAEERIAALETALGTQAARNAKLKVALEAMADIAPHNNQRAAILAEVIK